MTGFDSKRKIAMDKLDDDDVQVYAKPEQEPVICKHEWFRTGAMEMGECRCIKCGAWNSTKPAAQPAQEPAAWAVYDKRGGSKSLHWPENHSPNGDATMFDAVPLVPQRPWVGLTDEERSNLVTLHHGWNEYAQVIEAKLKEKNFD